MQQLRQPRQAASPGQVMVMFALFIFVLLGFVALSIDGGYIIAERRQTQSAADAGALAAATSLWHSRNGEITAAAQTYATDNAGPGSVASVNWPPTSGNFSGNPLYVQVTV